MTQRLTEEKPLSVSLKDFIIELWKRILSIMLLLLHFSSVHKEITSDSKRQVLEKVQNRHSSIYPERSTFCFFFLQFTKYININSVFMMHQIVPPCVRELADSFPSLDDIGEEVKLNTRVCSCRGEHLSSKSTNKKYELDIQPNLQ